MGKKKKGAGKEAGAAGKAPPTPEGISVIAEAVLNFKIHMKEQIITEHEDEAEVFRDKNYHQIERNRKLEREKEECLSKLFLQVKELETKSSQSKGVTRREVDKLFLGNIDYLQSSQREIIEMRDSIKRLDKELAVIGAQLQDIRHYRDVVLEKNNQKILSIKARMKFIEEERKEQEEVLGEQLKTIKADVQKMTEVMIVQQQRDISERLLESLDPEMKRELKDNVWLKREIELQKKAFNKLSEENNLLEQQNLKLMDAIHKIKKADLEAMRKVCKPEIPKPSANSSTARLMGSNNLLLQQQSVDIDSTPEDIPAIYSSLETKMMGVDGTLARLNTPPEGIKLPPLPGSKTASPAVANSQPYWPITSNMLQSLLYESSANSCH